MKQANNTKNMTIRNTHKAVCHVSPDMTGHLKYFHTPHVPPNTLGGHTHYDHTHPAHVLTTTLIPSWARGSVLYVGSQQRATIFALYFFNSCRQQGDDDKQLPGKYHDGVRTSAEDKVEWWHTHFNKLCQCCLCRIVNYEEL